MTLIHFVWHDTELSTFQMNIMELELLKRQLWVSVQNDTLFQTRKTIPCSAGKLLGHHISTTGQYKKYIHIFTVKITKFSLSEM